ncbi:MAG: chloride channel protein, partial [Gammaproteobacteria bacterium]
AGKIGFIFFAMLGGAPIGIEGPSIHIGGSIFYGFNRFLKLKRTLLIHALIAIGGSAGLIVAFNAPIAGVLFAYEEIGRKLKKQALILIATVSGLIYFLKISYHGSNPYLMDLSSVSFDLTLTWQLLPLVVMVGILGGLFSRITLYFVHKLILNSKIKVFMMALSVGMIAALFNYVSKGQIAGSGHTEVLQMLNSQSLGLDFVAMKFFAVLTSFVSTIPGGIFMPSISIGAGIGAELANFYTQIDMQVIMIMAMIGYLSAVIRAPLTSTFVILEMTMSLHLLIPGLAVAFIANFISKQIYHQPIYEALAERFSKTA